MDSTKKRERKANFSDNEVRCLLECIAAEKETIQCKLQGMVTARRKKEAWARICCKVNAVGQGSRNQDDVMKKWRDLKSAVLKEQMYQTKTGGGGPMKESPFKDLILYIIGDKSEVVGGIEVAGTDSFAIVSILETQLENEGESVFHQTASKSTVADFSTSQPCTATKRCLSMPSSSIITTTPLETSGISQPREDTATAPPTVSASHLKNKKRRRQPTSTQGDEVLRSLASSQIEANELKREKAALQREYKRSQIELNEVLRQKALSQIGLNEVLRQESLLRMQEPSTYTLKREALSSQIELNQALERECLLRIQHLKSGKE